MRASNNQLLGGLEPVAWAALNENGRRMELAKGDVLHETGAPLGFVYFPETAVLAVASETLAGESVNVALVGEEGVVGAFEACGSRQSFARVTAQIAGTIWRVPAAAYREAFGVSPGLRNQIHRYIEMLLVEARQFVACNALHTVENRLARSLLDAHDRAKSTSLSLTQDALAQLLGVQRTTIAAAISTLQREGLVRSGRGVVEIINLAGLERASCSCRQTVAYARREIQASPAEPCEV